MTLSENLKESARFMADRLDGRQPEIGIILGSGLGPLADSLQDAVTVNYGDVPYMRSSTAASHKGRFVCGMLGGKCVLVMQGRIHGYEGYASSEIAYPVWLMHELGIQIVILTNAVGAINPDYRPGEFVVISDHINFTGRNPIAGQEQNELAQRFFPMAECYDPELRGLMHQVSEDLDIAVHEGVYLGLLGPSFETAAEIRAFRIWGADTVAMSVVEEAIAARHVGMRVFGMSLVTNMACGVSGDNGLDDEISEVYATARAAEPKFCRLMTEFVSRI